MVSTSFSLYASVVAERWMEAVHDEEDVETRKLYKLDHQLFRRSTRNSCELVVRNGEFANDKAVSAGHHRGRI